MTALRRRMIEELQLRGYVERTVAAYVSEVARLAQYHHRPPDRWAKKLPVVPSREEVWRVLAAVLHIHRARDADARANRQQLPRLLAGTCILAVDSLEFHAIAPAYVAVTGGFRWLPAQSADAQRYVFDADSSPPVLRSSIARYTKSASMACVHRTP